MLIGSVSVKNFRCLLDATLNCQPLTVLVGPNGCGKSSFLNCLDLFYSASPRFGPEDFYNDDTTADIEITVTFTDLTNEAGQQFSSYVEEGQLTITRVLAFSDGKPSAKYYGSRLQNPDFRTARNAQGAIAARREYSNLRETSIYEELPTVTTGAGVFEELEKWEAAHPDQCIRHRDDGQFFGFTEVARGYLGRFSRLILIPAVREAREDATEGKGSPITEIMDLVVRSTLAYRGDLDSLRE